jgi:chemotaxis protein MotB
MKRRPRQPAARPLRASGDRWLFGYADVVTLLFACFASLYAMQAAPVARPAPAADDIALTPSTAATAPDVQDPSLAPLDDTLRRDLASIASREASLPGVELTTSSRGLVISLPEAGSFPPGQAELSEAVQRVMLGLAERLSALPNAIRVEGHTDDVPIHTALFASNWELSTARATAVVQFLIEEGGIEPARLSATGYAEYRPRQANDSPAARARNRRVDIVILEGEAR